MIKNLKNVVLAGIVILFAACGGGGGGGTSSNTGTSSSASTTQSGQYQGDSGLDGTYKGTGSYASYTLTITGASATTATATMLLSSTACTDSIAAGVSKGSTDFNYQDGVAFPASATQSTCNIVAGKTKLVYERPYNNSAAGGTLYLFNNANDVPARAQVTDTAQYTPLFVGTKQ